MRVQGAAPFDSLTALANVALPLREKTKLKEAEIEGKVLEMLDQVGLTGMGHKFPAELSGGMRKRAGLARALVMGPEIMLVDAPTTGLDRLLAGRVRDLSVESRRQDGMSSVV